MPYVEGGDRRRSEPLRRRDDDAIDEPEAQRAMPRVQLVRSRQVALAPPFDGERTRRDVGEKDVLRAVPDVSAEQMVDLR